jgi:DNA-binding MarR family transcriptional regulator
MPNNRPHNSEPDMLVLHALRLKGVAEPVDVSEATDLEESEADEKLSSFRDRELVKRRDGRISGFLLLPAGKELHATLLEHDLAAADCRSHIEACYAAFLDYNEGFKQLCGDWQLRTVDGSQVPNDHRDVAYDAAIAARLAALQPAVGEVIDELAAAMTRFAPYSRRLGNAVARFTGGEHTALAQPLARSYHDVWMELHEDFLVTLDRDRSEADGY